MITIAETINVLRNYTHSDGYYQINARHMIDDLIVTNADMREKMADALEEWAMLNNRRLTDKVVKSFH